VTTMIELRNAAPPELLELIDSADDYFAEHDLAPTNGEELAAMLDPEGEDDALGMIDDWEARLAVPQPLCDALREWIADRHNTSTRG
jgi:hypothetical protein